MAPPGDAAVGGGRRRGRLTGSPPMTHAGQTHLQASAPVHWETAGVAELAQQMVELRLDLKNLRQQCDALQRERAGLAGEVQELTTQIADLTARSTSLHTDLEQGSRLLAGLATLLDEVRGDDRRQDETLTEALGQQAQDRADLLRLLEAGGAEFALAVQALAESEHAARQQEQDGLAEVTRAVQDASRQQAEHLAEWGAALERLRDQEASAQERIAQQSSQTAQTAGRLSEALGAADSTLGKLLGHSRQMLAEQRQARVNQDNQEAARLNESGLKCLADGAFTDAVRCFEQAAKLAPDAREIQFNLALAHHQAGSPGPALALLTELTRTSPDWATAWLASSVVRLALNDPAGACQDLEAAVRVEPGEDRWAAANGLAHLLAGRVAPAVAAFRHAARNPAPGPGWLRGFARAEDSRP